MATKAGRRRQALRNIEPLRQECTRDQMAESLPSDEHSVRVTCLDEHGDQRVIDAAGWYARILQHEIDHLNGRLYTDIMLPETLTTVENHQRNDPAPGSAK